MEIKTIDDVKSSNLFGNSNYDNIINQSMIALSNNKEMFVGRNMDVGDTPISPMTLNDDYTPILLSEEVMLEYQKLVTLINNPETAKEYSYVLLGKSASFAGEKCYFVDRIIDCNSSINDLDSRETRMDDSKLNNAISYGRNNGYDFYSLCHTHPIVSEVDKQTTLASYLPEEVRKSEYIRDAGLNLSLQDFVSYEALYQYFASIPNIKTCQTVIMYNSEMAMFSKQNDELKRFAVIMDRLGEPIYVSSKEDYKKSNHTL